MNNKYYKYKIKYLNLKYGIKNKYNSIYEIKGGCDIINETNKLNSDNIPICSELTIPNNIEIIENNFINNNKYITKITFNDCSFFEFFNCNNLLIGNNFYE